jgi:hypothetical protein
MWEGGVCTLWHTVGPPCPARAISSHLLSKSPLQGSSFLSCLPSPHSLTSPAPGVSECPILLAPGDLPGLCSSSLTTTNSLEWPPLNTPSRPMPESKRCPPWASGSPRAGPASFLHPQMAIPCWGHAL